jgi:hypothetical protein
MLSWTFQDTDDNLLRVFNVLSPAAVRARAKASLLDTGKPLGKGLASRLKVIGGEIQLEHHVGNNPFLNASPINGLRLPVVGGYACRTDDRRILGHVEIAKAAAIMVFGDGELSDAYDFYSASEYISDDPEHPTVFQNLITQLIPAGRRISIPGRGTVPIPFEYSISASTEAVGYIADGRFVGTMRLSYNFDFSKMQSQIRHMLTLQFGNIPDRSYVTGAGRFDMSLLPDL